MQAGGESLVPGKRSIPAVSGRSGLSHAGTMWHLAPASEHAHALHLRCSREAAQDASPLCVCCACLQWEMHESSWLHCLQASSQQNEAVIDLTSYSPDDVAADMLPPKKKKQHKSMPAIVQQAEALQPAPDAPEPLCPICLDPMKAMACGPCGWVMLWLSSSGSILQQLAG